LTTQQQGLPVQTDKFSLELNLEYPIRGLFPLLDSLGLSSF